MSPGADTSEVGPVAVAVVSLLVGLVAWGLLAVLERSVADPGRAWGVIAVVVLVLSLAGPLGAGVTSSARAALAAMHLVAGAILIPSLVRTAARR